MKTLLLALIMLTGTLFANNANTDWVDQQIQAIKPPRSGVSHVAINRVKNPFIYVYEKKTGTTKAGTTKAASTASAVQVAKTAPLRLGAVMNTSALINGTWYQVNDKVRGYSVAKIETDSVLLTSGKTKKMLFVTSENPNIQIQIK